MITFFTVPKSGEGLTCIEREATASWGNLPVEKEILLFWGDSVQKSPQGTPLLDDVFAQSAAKAQFDILIYVNADILFTFELLPPVQFISKKFHKFLMVGQRTDVPPLHLNFNRMNCWDDVLRASCRDKGKLHPTCGIDYFIFKRDMVKEFQMPPFVVGRPAWDNWMIARCIELGYPVVDATEHILAVHQNHDFSHLKGGRKESRHGIEAQENRRLAGDKVATIEDATHQLEELL